MMKFQQLLFNARFSLVPDFFPGNNDIRDLASSDDEIGRCNEKDSL